MAAPARKLESTPDRTPIAVAGVSRRAQLALAVLSGLLYVAAFPGINQWYLAFIAFVPVLYASHQASVKRTLFLGAIVGLISHMIAYYWITHMVQAFTPMPWIAGAGIWLLLCVGQGTSYGVGVALAQWLRQRTGWPYAVTLAVGLAAMDFCYPLIFPSYIANTMNGAIWMMQIADIFGVLGLTALIGAINGAFVDAILARRMGRPWPVRTLATVGGLWIATIAYGAWRTADVDRTAAAAPKLKIGFVQANFGGLANLRERTASLQAHRRLTKDLTDQGADLVLWPEGALEAVISVGTNIHDWVLPNQPQPAMIFGAVREGPDPATPGRRLPFNAAFLADRTGRVLSSYDKEVLLVFGEYIPFGDAFPRLYDWIENASHWGRGTSTAPLVLDDWKLGTFICYEDILPRYVQRIMAAHDGTRPDVMINITNDSWYGPYKEQQEHQALAAFRAVEHHRALVRDTNTGISAFIDPAGRILDATPIFKEAARVRPIPRMTGTTVYEVIGDVVGYAALLILAGVWVQTRRRPRAA